MRRFVLLTGRPGVGKTTAVGRAVRQLQEDGVDVLGFWTEEVRDNDGRRTGFDIVRVDGSRVALSRKGEESDVRVGSYAVRVGEAGRAFVTIASEVRSAGPDDVAVIDEIGPMEVAIDSFEELVETARKGAASLIVTYKQGSRDPLLARLRQLDGAADWTVTTDNRDAMPPRIVQALQD